MTKLKSMTGYGRAEFALSSGAGVTVGYFVEVKSLNNKGLDIGVKTPDRFIPLELKIRDVVKKRFARGSFGVYIGYGSRESVAGGVNMELVKNYLDAEHELKEKFGLEGALDVAFFLKLKDIFSASSAKVDADEDWKALVTALEAALTSLESMRIEEGAALTTDVEKKLKSLEGHTARVAALAPEAVAKQRDKLKAAITELVPVASEERILTEAAINAERGNIDEELTRLKSHIAQARGFLALDEPVGRRLDFLCQEFLREANTIASKSQDIEITRISIEIKSDIEKIREQVQNIE